MCCGENITFHQVAKFSVPLQDVGNTLEPSAGTGVFNETKPVGTVMTATEISSVSGRINQLLHPEDSVQISPFEQLAVSTPNDSFDHVVGNVPFGGRDNTRNIDKPYAEETDMGSYFMLRMLDKIKPGGFMCVIVPPSIVSGSNMKRLRLRLSRKAEFLGAHRLPTGTGPLCSALGEQQPSATAAVVAF